MFCLKLIFSWLRYHAIHNLKSLELKKKVEILILSASFLRNKPLLCSSKLLSILHKTVFKTSNS